MGPAGAHACLPRPPSLRPRKRLGCGTSRASRGLLFGRGRAQLGSGGDSASAWVWVLCVRATRGQRRRRNCGRKRNAPPRPPNAEPSSSRTSPPTSRRTTHELFPLLSYNHHQRRLAHPTGGATKRKLNSPVTYPSRPDWRARDPRPHTSALHTRTCPSRPTAIFDQLAQRTRTNFNPQHWLLCHMGLY